MASDIHWTGQSGQKYHYKIYPIPTDFNPQPGNYVFAKETKPRHWVPVYLGQTANLGERFDNHHKLPCITGSGATHIHVHANSSQQARLAEEADLVARWDPPCNG